MTRARAVSEALKVCRRLAGHAQGTGRTIAAAVTRVFSSDSFGSDSFSSDSFGSDGFGGDGSGGGGFVDVWRLQVGVADRLEGLRAELVAWADRHAAEVERGRRLRQRRDRLVLALRSAVSRLKGALAAAFDARTASRLVDPVRRLAAGPGTLHDQVARFRALLVDPELEVPPPRPGVGIDLVAAAEGLEEPMEWLGETLAELAGNEAAARHAGARRDRALEAVADFAGKAARFYAALADLVGHQRPAGRPMGPRRRPTQED